MEFDIRHKFGHWELYVNGKFYGSYDTAVEAAKDIDKIKEGKNQNGSI